MIYGTPTIVTNGLVLNLDAANPKSIPLDPTVNLMINSENYLAGSGWTRNNTTVVTSSAVPAPFGTESANLWSAITSFATLYRETAVYQGTYTFSWYIRYINQQYYSLVLEGASPGRVTFDILNGTTVGGTLAQNAISSIIEPAPNGYYRIGLTTNITTGSIPLARFSLWTGPYSGNSYSGSQAYIWGAQLERNSYMSPYIQSTSTLGRRTTWGDLSGNNNVATLATASISSSIPQYSYLNGRILNFDGTGSYANLGIVPALSPSQLTVSVWFNLSTTSNTVSANQLIRNRTYGYGISATDRSVACYVYPNSTIPTTTAYTIPNTLINFNTWYNVVMTYGNSTFRVYLNGVLQSGDIASPTNTIFYGSGAGGNSIGIGRDADSPSNYLFGKIGTTQVYNRALTQQEVAQNYNAYKSRYGLS